jgi:hypothetical protein
VGKTISLWKLLYEMLTKEDKTGKEDHKRVSHDPTGCDEAGQFIHGQQEPRPGSTTATIMIKNTPATS